MSKTLKPDLANNEYINYEEAISQMFVEMKQANEKMVRAQAEIERLKAETREILERLKATRSIT